MWDVSSRECLRQREFCPASLKQPWIVTRFFSVLNRHHKGSKHTAGKLKRYIGASLVVQWLRVCLPMQGTRVRALVWEDPTCRGATAPVSHNYCWACASGARAPQRDTATVRGPRTAMNSGPRSPQREKALTQKQRPKNTGKKKNYKTK